jgi:succinate dehydrogenase/fumarate reductase cytochrome b subunit
MNTAKIQIYSGLGFLVFLVIHLGTHSMALVSKESVDQTFSIVRRFYQHPYVEFPLVISSLLVHGVVGIKHFLSRSRNARFSGTAKSMNTVAGLSLLVIVPLHALATRLLPMLYMKSGAAGYAFVARSLVILPYFFIPYYIIFVGMAVYHAVFGVGRALQSITGRLWLPKITASKWWVTVALLGLVFGALVMAAYAGAFYTVDTNAPDALEAAAFYSEVYRL